MNKIKQKITNFINTIQNSKDRKLYIMGAIALLCVIVLGILIFGGESEGQNELINDNSVKTSNYELDTKKIDSNATIITTPPPIVPLVDNNNATLPQKSYEIDIKALKEQASIQVLPQQNNNMTNIKSVDEISSKLDEKRDMKSYLKSIQMNIVINQDSFTYNDKIYRVGEKFDGYLIEAITPIFIRFADDKSALHYNLRFIQEN